MGTEGPETALASWSTQWMSSDSVRHLDSKDREQLKNTCSVDL